MRVCGDLPEQRFGHSLLPRQNILYRQAGEHRSHAAGNVEADAAGRDHASLRRIEGGHAADRKPLTPMGIGHRDRGRHDPRQGGDIAGLLTNFIVHLGDKLLIRENDRRHAHRSGRFDAPRNRIKLSETCPGLSKHLTHR